MVAQAPASSSPWKIQFDGPQGLTLSYQNVPIIRQSSLAVVKPGWTGSLFDGRNQKYQITSGNGALPSLTAQSENEVFRANYRFEVVDSQTFVLRFKGELKQDVPAVIEYSAGQFNANLISNRPFRAQTVKGEKSGLVPNYPTGKTHFENDLAPEFKTLDLDSRLGTLKIEVNSPARVVFFDARRAPQEWAKPTPLFWCGWLGDAQPLKMGHPVELEIKIKLVPRIPPQNKNATLKSAFRPIKSAYSVHDQPLQVIPRPQRMVAAGEARFALTPNMRVSLAVPRGEKRLQRALQRILRDEWGLKIPAPQISEHDGTWSRIVLGTAPAQNSGSLSGQTNWRKSDEGYRLQSGKQGVEITSGTARGAFYGLQTLAQVIRSKSETITCPALTIEDWPVLAFRGAHWYPSASGVPFHKKLIGNVLARYKFNSCVIQCEAARWDTDPLIAGSNSISKADLRALVQLCRDNFIEPIPLINGPGHAEWMFRNGRNIELAEDPKTPYAYSVNNPKSLAFIKSILSEVIDVFRPTYFHIGHDEVTMRGRFPNPQSPFYQADMSAGDLVLKNLRELHGWLKNQNIKTMIWGDMLIAGAEGVDAAHAPDAAEARRRRSLVPSDVVIVDWHYGTNEKYPSLDLFQQTGLNTIAASWYMPLNIRHFSKAASTRSQGLLQTTWAGFFPDESTLKTEMRQFSAFILAGDYAWSNREELPTALPYDDAAEWWRTYNAGSGITQDRAGTLVDLSPVAQVSAQDWVGLGLGWDLSALSPSDGSPKRYGDILFTVPKGKMAVLSAKESLGLAPEGALASLEVPLKRKAGEVAVLHTALWPTPVGTPIGQMRVDYGDGTQENWELKQGQNITSWQRDSAVAEAARGWTSPVASSSPTQQATSSVPADTVFTLRVARWTNPHPAKTIVKLRFTPLSGESGWALAGLTLLDSGATTKPTQ